MPKAGPYLIQFIVISTSRLLLPFGTVHGFKLRLGRLGTLLLRVLGG